MMIQTLCTTSPGWKDVQNNCTSAHIFFPCVGLNHGRADHFLCKVMVQAEDKLELTLTKERLG